MLFKKTKACNVQFLLGSCDFLKIISKVICWKFSDYPDYVMTLENIWKLLKAKSDKMQLVVDSQKKLITKFRSALKQAYKDGCYRKT
jgi:hypothetical protein